MREHRQQWAQRIRERSRERGFQVSTPVVDQFVDYLTDAYQHECDEGASVTDAQAAIVRLIDDADYPAMVRVRRTARRDSSLLNRSNMSGSFTGVLFDVRYAFRAMRRHVAFSAAIIAMLAVGIGFTTAAYGVIYAVLLQALPYPSPGRVVVLKHGVAPNESGAFAAGDWRDYAARPSLEGLAAYSQWPMNLTGTGEPERLRSVIVSGDFFSVMGVSAAIGRTATAADDASGALAVVVLSDGMWRRRFGADRAVLGRTLELNGQAATVVGVMPSTFAMPSADTDLWMPMALSPKSLADHDGEWLSLVGRLRPGITPDRAQADLSAITDQLATAFPRPSRDKVLIVRRLADEIVSGARRALWLGAFAALFVLIAGMANAANLLLARATARHDEIAVRAALGADAVRLARQLFIETAVLAVCGGVLGSALSWVFLRLFTAVAGDRVPRVDQVGFDARVFFAAVVVSAVTACVVGGYAAWFVSRRRVLAPSSVASHRVVRPAVLQGLLLSMQVALALILVTGAAVVVRGYVATVRVNPGFDPSATRTMQLTLPRSRYPDSASHIRFVDAALSNIRALPEVTHAGVVSDLPFEGNAMHFAMTSRGEPEAAGRMTTVRVADGGFFETLRIPVVAGRLFNDEDRGTAEPVAILNRSAAARYDGMAALGRRLRASGDVERTIVGIVGDIKHAGLHADEGPVLYVPYTQKTSDFLNWMGLVVRVNGVPPSVTAIRHAIASVDPNQPVEGVRLMADYLDREAAPYRFTSVVVGSLAGVALILALAGIYGLTTFIVGRRTRELALRRALGASVWSIVLIVARQIAVALALGAVVGVAGSAAINHLIVASVGELALSGASLSTTLAVWLATALAALVAALGPAWRGASVAPWPALHCE